jgi:glyoxylase-like metal-dependent hydrolase (beta-lactamase superfamily II)
MVLVYGTLVKDTLSIQDGVRLQIIPIPNSHAKGSLCVLVNDEYLILGDSFYTNKNGYNVSLLHDEIALLEQLNFCHVLLSHDREPHSKEEILETLKSYYGKRKKNNPYIPLNA